MQFSSFFKCLVMAGLAAFIVPVSAQDSTSKIKRVGYFEEWGVYEKNYEIADIPAKHLSHLLYAFAVIDSSTNECMIYDSYASLEKPFPAKNGFAALNSPPWTDPPTPDYQEGNFGRIKQLKALNPHLKVLLSVGGWTKSGDFSAAASPAHVEHFAESCVAMMNQYGFDGLDFDWEYPVRGGVSGDVCTAPAHAPADKQNFTALLKSVKQKLKPGQELTIAAAARPDYIQHLEVKKLSDEHIVDAIHIMAYDYHGSWNSFAAHHAPLYAADTSIDLVEVKMEDDAKKNPPKINPATGLEQDSQCVPGEGPDYVHSWNADAGVQAFLDAGADPSILVLGAPFYGRAWMVTNPAAAAHHGLYQPATGQVSITKKDGNWEDGYFDYWKIQNMIQAGDLNSYIDTVSHAPYAYSDKTGLFISYDSVDSIREKVEYVKSKQLGGIMFWSLDGDIRGDVGTSLLNAASCEISPNDAACIKP